MKFAKVFQQALDNEQIPPEWVAKAIQYKQLKKRINKVVNELDKLNINIDKNNININYELEIIENCIHPHLSVPITALIKNRIVDQLNDLGYEFEIVPIVEEVEGEEADSRSVLSINPFDDTNYCYNLKISLLEDAKFFQILYNEVETLDKFKDEEEMKITNNIELMCTNISQLTIPNKKNNDLYIWRQIFSVYIESEIFFSTIERMAGNVDIEMSKQRLILFFKRIKEMSLTDKFKNKQSIQIFQNFKNLNFNIIKISSYENFNNLAVKKILKKFDKNTKFQSKEVFPQLIFNKNEKHLITILDGSIAKDIFFIISNKLLPIIPQIDDYLCPICCSLAFKPIRLKCNHLFCIRCLVKLRRKNEDKCPLCRENCLLELTVDDLDRSTYNYMKLYFPQEVREKEMENSREILHEQYGDSKPCVIM